MKDKFAAYFRPTEEDFRKMWEEGVFVFDTNVLLNLYRYSLDARSEWIEVMRSLTERMWLPYQVAHEFLDNRLGVVHQQLKSHQGILRVVDAAQAKLEGAIRTLYRDTAVEEKALDRIGKRFGALREDLAQPEGEAILETSSISEDPVLEALIALYQGRVGDPLGNEDSPEFATEAQARIDKRIPPGFRDREKDENPLGDIILWFQIKAFAKNDKRPMLLVTDDQKEDWWLEVGEKRIGPRPELIAEMREEAGCAFYAYMPDEFLRLAKEYLAADVSKEAIGEAERLVSLQDLVTVQEARSLRERIGKIERQLTSLRVQESNSIPELLRLERLTRNVERLVAELDDLRRRERDIQETLVSATPEDRTERLEDELAGIRLEIQEHEMEIDRQQAGIDRRRSAADENIDRTDAEAARLTGLLAVLRRRLALAERRLPASIVEEVRMDSLESPGRGGRRGGRRSR